MRRHTSDFFSRLHALLRRAPAKIEMMLLLLLACGMTGRAAFGAAAVTEEFSGKQVDEGRWIIDPKSPPGRRIEVDQGRLHIVIPPGPTGRPPAKMQGRFKVTGDAVIQAEYFITALPRPETDWVNLELFIEGEDGAAAIIRGNHSKLDQGYTLYFGTPPESGRSGSWKNVETQDQHGWLRLERVGTVLKFLAGADVSKLSEIGQVEFGTAPIETVAIRVVVPATSSTIDVALDNITIETTGELIGPTPAAGHMLGNRAWIGITLMTVAAIGIAALLVKRAPRQGN